jgi:hypothetical protein
VGRPTVCVGGLQGARGSHEALRAVGRRSRRFRRDLVPDERAGPRRSRQLWSPGGSIQQALSRFSGEDLRILVQGTCREQVVVGRSRVQIVGVDASAGTRTPADDRTGAPLRISGASDVVVSALTLAGGLYGLVVDDHSTLHFVRSAAGNVLTGTGAYVADGSVLELREAVLSGNVQAEYGARVVILSSSVSGPETVLSFHELAAGVVDASSFVSTLLCATGGEVTCDPGAFVGSSTCGGCPAGP